jgi:CIC family chloride channel protein
MSASVVSVPYLEAILLLCDDVNTALRCFTATEIDELPVVDPDDRSRLLGTLRHKETIAAYNRMLAEYKRASEEHA